MKSSRIATTLLLLAASVPAHAELNNLQSLSQAEFRALSEDLGSALSYKPLTPAAPLGLFGFDLGVAVTATKLKNPDLFKRATSDADFPATVGVPSVRAGLGLPLGFDVGAMYSSIPKTGAYLWGGALSWGVVPDGAWPAFGVRASYTKMLGVEQLDLATSGLDASISKSFGWITPYVGGGKVWVTSTPIASTGLHKESTIGMGKAFVGLNLNVSVVNFALEYDKTGKANSYGAKLGLRF